MAIVEHNIYKHFLGSKTNDTDHEIILYWSTGEEYRIPIGADIWLPKQVEAMHAAEDPKTEILGLGGALGGSKSHTGRAIVAERLTTFSKFRGKGMVADEPIVGAIFSENYPALRGRHIDQIKNWPDWLGKYYKSDKEFHFHKNFNSPVLKLLNLDQPEKYGSFQFAVGFIDESTFNTEKVFNDVHSRIRWPGIKNTLMIWASNPGRIGHGWHKRRFVDPKTREAGTVFIPSLLRDNPFLNEDPKYRKILDRLPPKIRSAWLEGSWELFEGQYFPDLNPDIHYIKPFRIPQEWARYRIIDHGFKHPTAVLWGAVDKEGTLYIYRTYESLETTADINKRNIHELSIDQYTGNQERYMATFCDPAVKREDGSAVGNKTPYEVYNDMYDGIGSFDLVEAMRDRVEGWQALQQAFHFEIDSDESEKQETTIFKSHPKIYIFDQPTHTCYLGGRLEYHSGNALWEELNALVYDDKKAEDAAKSKGYYGIGEGDDSPECLRYLWAMVGDSVFTQLKFERRSDAILRSDFNASPKIITLDDFATQPRNPYLPW